MNKPTYKQIRMVAMLKKNKAWLTRVQYLTLKGQVYAGDVAGAYKGLQRIKGERA